MSENLLPIHFDRNGLKNELKVMDLEQKELDKPEPEQKELDKKKLDRKKLGRKEINGKKEQKILNPKFEGLGVWRLGS